MIKIIYILLAIIIIILGASFFIKNAENIWLCENGQWIKHGQPTEIKPMTACERPQSNYFNTLATSLNKAKILNQQSYTLDLSQQQLKSLTTEFFNNNSQIQILNLSYNQLTGALPAEIRHLQALKILKASHNQLTGIPAEIGQLHQLTEIDFSYNKLTTMPNEIGNLKNNLKILDLSYNNYQQTQLDAIKILLPTTQIINHQ